MRKWVREGGIWCACSQLLFLNTHILQNRTKFSHGYLAAGLAGDKSAYIYMLVSLKYPCADVCNQQKLAAIALEHRYIHETHGRAYAQATPLESPC